MDTRVVNLYREPYDVYIGRAGKGQDGYFGNPYTIGKDGNRDQVLAKYEVYANKRFDEDLEFRRRIRELRGKTLGCFCKPEACHGDILAYLIRRDYDLEHELDYEPR